MSPQRTRQAGFSLLEMLVGLTLLGLISVAVTQSVRTGLRMWKAAESNNELAEWNQTKRLLEHWMSRALSPRGFDIESQVIFDPAPTGVRFLVDGGVGRKPSGYSRLSLQAGENPACTGRVDLLLSWEDVSFASNFAMSASDRRVIIACADTIAFEYGDERLPPSGLQPKFVGGRELPQIVRIRVTRDGETKVLAARLLYAL